MSDNKIPELLNILVQGVPKKPIDPSPNPKVQSPKILSPIGPDPIWQGQKLFEVGTEICPKHYQDKR